jgi:hypothetical protein
VKVERVSGRLFRSRGLSAQLIPAEMPGFVAASASRPLPNGEIRGERERDLPGLFGTNGLQSFMHSAETYSLAHVVCFENTQSRRSFDESKEKSRLRAFENVYWRTLRFQLTEALERETISEQADHSPPMLLKIHIDQVLRGLIRSDRYHPELLRQQLTLFHYE